MRKDIKERLAYTEPLLRSRTRPSVEGERETGNRSVSIERGKRATGMGGRLGPGATSSKPSEKRDRRTKRGTVCNQSEAMKLATYLFHRGMLEMLWPYVCVCACV
ncbi:hypothetical protein ZHAS_00014640 [Anopheles sinensis]|uniref:Uncharacterized protein n=1 Tax=Anopheles sinensis TaxID=74873 RepID=A0A084W8Q6_ANOSI|nr:hypothetical protein ZHAS_00014640 [Anopheles sinensis]